MITKENWSEFHSRLMKILGRGRREGIEIMAEIRTARGPEPLYSAEDEIAGRPRPVGPVIGVTAKIVLRPGHDDLAAELRALGAEVECSA